MILAALLLSMPQPPQDRPVQAGTVLTVLDIRDALDHGARAGETVRVVGIVSDECARACSLRTTLGGWERGAEAVSLASGTPVEARLHALAGKPVVLRARVGEAALRILPDGNIVITADRAPELIPIEIEE